MSTKIETIMSHLSTLTLLEAAELVKKIEETFGVDASAGMRKFVNERVGRRLQNRSQC